MRFITQLFSSSDIFSALQQKLKFLYSRELAKELSGIVYPRKLTLNYKEITLTFLHAKWISPTLTLPNGKN